MENKLIRFLLVGGLVLTFGIGMTSCSSSTTTDSSDSSDETSANTESSTTTSSSDDDSSDSSYDTSTDDNSVTTSGLNYTMNDYETDSYYTGTDYTSEQQFINTVADVNDSVVTMTVYDEDGTASAEGSGVLFAWDTDNDLSYILTCYHMVEDYYSYTVETNDGVDYDATLVGGYADEDLAIIAISTDDDVISSMTYATLLDSSSSLYQGQTAIAIGNNDGYSDTVSDGIISYTDRTINAYAYNYKDVHVLQMTTEINGGNSGGGVFSTSGALIGIVNMSVETNSEGYSVEGIKFAVPYTYVNNAISEIMSTATYSNGTFGAGYYEGDFEFGFTLSYTTDTNGDYYPVISAVCDSTNDTYSDADADFEQGDIITEISCSTEDLDVTSFDSAYETAWEALYNSGLSLDDTVEFTIERPTTTSFGGASTYTPMTIDVTLQQFIFQALTA